VAARVKALFLYGDRMITSRDLGSSLTLAALLRLWIWRFTTTIFAWWLRTSRN